MRHTRHIVLSSLVALSAVSSGMAGFVACTCPGDFDENGVVDGADLGFLLSAWGIEDGDLNGNKTTDGADLGILLAAWGPCAAADNDNCQFAYQVFGGESHPFCNANATTDGPLLTPDSCGLYATTIVNDMWFEYYALGDGTLTLDTCGSTFDTVIAVYGSATPGGSPCPGSFDAVQLACNDDGGNCGSVNSKVVMEVEGNSLYKIRVGSYFFGGSGAGVLNVAFTSVGQQCYDGVTVIGADGVTQTVSGSTADNQPTGLAPCGLEQAPGEWITYVPSCPNEHVFLSTCNPGTGFDTVISVWRDSISQGCDGWFIECVDDSSGTSCQLDGLNRKSKLDFFASAGEVYHILVTGYDALDSGFYLLEIETDCFVGP